MILIILSLPHPPLSRFTLPPLPCTQLPGTWFIYVGSLPISLGFLSIAAFSYYDSWDPVLIALKKLVHCIFRFRCCSAPSRGKSHSRSRGGASESHDLKEQKESLIQHEQKCANS